MDTLERFCRGNQFKLPSLKTLRIERCFSFTTFVSDSIIENATHRSFSRNAYDEDDWDIWTSTEDLSPLFGGK
ncbi:hypothetical protein CCACVL1_22839, partial [Corchorus capsularis]